MLLLFMTKYLYELELADCFLQKGGNYYKKAINPFTYHDSSYGKLSIFKSHHRR